MNISLTPVECSVVCPRELATRFFNPARDELEPSLRQQCCISQDDYIVIQVYGDGLDAGKRVLELTSPLAMSGMSVPLFPFLPKVTPLPQRLKRKQFQDQSSSSPPTSPTSSSSRFARGPLLSPPSRHAVSHSSPTPTLSSTSPRPHPYTPIRTRAAPPTGPTSLRPSPR